MQAAQILLRQKGLINRYGISSASASKKMTRAAANGVSRRLMTFSFWTKTSASDFQNMPFGAGFLTDYVTFSGIGGGIVVIVLNGGVAGQVQTSAGINNGAWRHVVVQLDTANGTAANRGIIYVDGSAAALTTVTPITLNYDTTWSTAGGTEEEAYQTTTAGTAVLFDELARVDGSLLPPAAFAANGKPKNLKGLNFGTQGWWQRYECPAASSIGVDSSPNGNNFANTSFVDTDFSTDCPPS